MRLEGKSLKSDFLRFIIPSVVAQWVFTLYTLVDGIFVAKGVSEVALAAVNIAMPFTMALFSVSILFAVGTSTVVAILLGEGKGRRANEVFTQNIVFLIVLSVFITVVTWAGLDPLAKFLGATESTLPYVKEYIGTLIPFSFGFILSYSFETLIKTDGFPKRATIIVTSGAVLNCILDYLFVMVFHMGVFGAAFATGLSQVWVILFYLKHFLGKSGTIHFAKFKPDFPLLWREFKNGIPSGLTEMSAGATIFFFNQAILRFLSEDALVSYTIISYVNSIVVMSMVGIAQGYQPLISYYLGKQKPERCRLLFRYGLLATVVVSAAAFLFCFAGADWIVSLFVSADLAALQSYSAKVFRIFILSFLLMGFNVVIGGYFTAMEKPAYATAISLSRGFVTLALSLLLLTAVFGGPGIWWSATLSEGLCLLLTLGILIRHRRKSLSAAVA